MAWYRAGTVSVTNNSSAVTGAGTAWVTAAAVGETFLGPDGQSYEIVAINSATSLTIAPVYKGGTASAQGYAIMPTQGYLRDLAAAAAALVESYSSVKNNAGTGKFAAGTSANPSLRNAADENTGLNLKGSDQLALVTAGVERLALSASGVPSGTAVTHMLDRTNHTGTQAISTVTALQDALDAKLDANDPSVTNAREWTASVVSQAEAEAGTATTARKWAAQRVRQAITGWWATVGTTFGKALLNSSDANQARTNLGLGTAATADVTTSSTDTAADRVMKVGDFGVGVITVTDSPTNPGLGRGIYTGHTASSGYSNAPFGSVGYNFIQERQGTYYGQLALSLSGSRVSYRSFQADTIETASWRELARLESPAFTGTPTIASAYSTTTASSANVFVTSTGAFQRSTSSERYKKDIEPADDSMMQKVIDTAQPVWYRSICDSDPDGFSYWGLIAEHLAEIDPRFVHWAKHDVDGPLQAEGVMYDRLVVPLLWHAKKMQARIEALESRLAAMEDK